MHKLLCSIALTLSVCLFCAAQDKVDFSQGWLRTATSSYMAVEALDSIPTAEWVAVRLPDDFSATDGRTLWYRKSLLLPSLEKEALMKDKMLNLMMEGLSCRDEIYVNGNCIGCGMGERAGMQNFEISDYLLAEEENVILVKIAPGNSDIYGSGLLCEPELTISDVIFLDPSTGLRPRISISDDLSTAEVKASLTAVNRSTVSQSGLVASCALYDPKGRLVYTAKKNFDISAMATLDLRLAIKVTSPVLWGPKNPALYRLEAFITQSGPDGKTSTLSTLSRRLGFRKVEYDSSKGLIINRENVMLKGAILPLSHTGVGHAVPYSLWQYKLEILKSFGFNAVRTEGVASSALLDACDRAGMLVLDESLICGTSAADLSLAHNIVCSYMSHPSILLWGIGYPEGRTEPANPTIKARLSSFITHLDGTREVICANHAGSRNIAVSTVMGFDHIDQSPVDMIQTNCPESVLIGTCEPSGCGTRGVYRQEAGSTFLVSANRSGVQPDLVSMSDEEGFSHTAEGLVTDVIARSWKFYSSRDFAAGMFYDCAFDHQTSKGYVQSGIFDECGFPKDEAWYLRSLWKPAPMVYVSPHWNSPCKEGENVPLVVYSNCEVVEFELDGESLGKLKMPSSGILHKDVPFRKGRLVVKGYNNGKQVTSVVKSTAKEPLYTIWQVKSYNELTIINVDVCDVDERLTPDANVSLKLSFPSGWTILGCGNGNPSSDALVSAGDNFCIFSSFNGKAQVLLCPPARGQKLSDMDVVVTVR